MKKEVLVRGYESKYGEKFEYMKYKKFSKHTTAYVELINLIYEQYRTVEILSLETEKVINLYLENFIEKNKSVSKTKLLLIQIKNQKKIKLI